MLYDVTFSRKMTSNFGKFCLKILNIYKHAQNKIFCVNKVWGPAGVSHTNFYLIRSKFKVAITKNVKILKLAIAKKPSLRYFPNFFNITLLGPQITQSNKIWSEQINDVMKNDARLRFHPHSDGRAGEVCNL